MGSCIHGAGGSGLNWNSWLEVLDSFSSLIRDWRNEQNVSAWCNKKRLRIYTHHQLMQSSAPGIRATVRPSGHLGLTREIWGQFTLQLFTLTLYLKEKNLTACHYSPNWEFIYMPLCSFRTNTKIERLLAIRRSVILFYYILQRFDLLQIVGSQFLLMAPTALSRNDWITKPC